MKQCLIAVILIFLALPLSNATAAELEPLLQQAKSHQHTKPFQAIKLLEQGVASIQSADDDIFFEFHRLLLRLYLKVGSVQKVDLLIAPIHARFKQSDKYKP